ncbi:transposase [Chromobacterium vaccinii]|uniref:transposase n=1 Tax=Chromobacterium vaccinii TaxID=1108595 RepID=UPI001E51EA90|nr:transposase [Chromobacterium vaccinii]MCD4485381.1 transposase [Chromobacterium vaccinii]
MKKSKFTEEQTVFASCQAVSGTTVAVVCRKMGMFEATFYNGKKKRWPQRQRTTPPEATGRGERPSQAHSGRPEPGQMDVAESHPHKAVKPARNRELANFLLAMYRVSIRRTTAVIKLWQGTYFLIAPTLGMIERSDSGFVSSPPRAFTIAHTASLSCCRAKTGGFITRKPA